VSDTDKIYVDARRPANLRNAGNLVPCPTLQEAVLTWYRLPAKDQAEATIELADGEIYTAHEIIRLNYGPKPVADRSRQRDEALWGLPWTQAGTVDPDDQVIQFDEAQADEAQADEARANEAQVNEARRRRTVASAAPRPAEPIGRRAKVIGLLVAAVLLLSLVSPIREAAKSLYCGILACAPAQTKEYSKVGGAESPKVDTQSPKADTRVLPPKVDKTSAASPQPRHADAPKPPTSKELTFPAIEALDGSRSKAGTMTRIKLSAVDNTGNGPDTFAAQWTWSASGGTANGSQTVIINVKSESGATVQTIRIPLDRSQCYYSGNNERHEGELTVSAALVHEIEVSITPVEGRQRPC